MFQLPVNCVCTCVFFFTHATAAERGHSNNALIIPAVDMS